MLTLFVCKTSDGRYIDRWLSSSTPNSDATHEGEEFLFRIDNANPSSESTLERALEEVDKGTIPLNIMGGILTAQMLNALSPGD